FDEQTRLLDTPAHHVRTHISQALSVEVEQIEGKLRASIRVEKQLCIVEPLPKLLHDRVWIVADVDILRLDQGGSSLEHGGIGGSGRFMILAVVQENLRLKSLPFTGRQTELRHGDHLAGTFAYPHVTKGVLPGITPISVIAGVLGIGGYMRQVLQQRPQ